MCPVVGLKKEGIYHETILSNTKLCIHGPHGRHGKNRNKKTKKNEGNNYGIIS